MRKILMPAVALSLIAAPTLAFAKSATAPAKTEKPVKAAKPAKVKAHQKDKKAS